EDDEVGAVAGREGVGGVGGVDEGGAGRGREDAAGFDDIGSVEDEVAGRLEAEGAGGVVKGDVKGGVGDGGIGGGGEGWDVGGEWGDARIGAGGVAGDPIAAVGGPSAEHAGGGEGRGGINSAGAIQAATDEGHGCTGRARERRKVQRGRAGEAEVD